MEGARIESLEVKTDLSGPEGESDLAFPILRPPRHLCEWG